MKIKSFYFLSALVFSVAVLFVLNFSPARAAGLIPCGGPAESPCTLCHFIIGIQNIVKLALGLITTLCFAAIFFAGVMYVISAGNEGMMTQAKAFLSSSLIGFGVVMAAWLIVTVVIWTLASKSDLGIGKTSWSTFTCNTTSYQSSGSSTTAPVAPVVDPSAPVGATGGCCVIKTGSCVVVNNSAGCTNGTFKTQACSAVNECNFKTCGANEKGYCSYSGLGLTLICPSGSSAVSGGSNCPTSGKCCTP